MDLYLEEAKSILENIDGVSRLHVVIGNEACDMDSAVSAVVYAFYLHKARVDKSTCVVPVMNVVAHQFRTRTDTEYVFKKLNLPVLSLIFKDQIDLKDLHHQGKLLLTLVDHNVLPADCQALDDCVVAVLDHHVNERPDNPQVSVKLDFVGSCCTLIAEELLKDPDFVVDATVAELLYGTILIDTINRSPEAGKITARDESVLQQLESIIPNVKGDNLYEKLQAAKFDISGFTNMEILEKDLKMVDGAAMTIAVSSVTMDMQELLVRSDFKADLDEFCHQKKCDVVVVITLMTNDEGRPLRQIAVYSQNRIFRDQVANFLDICGDVDLQLEQIFAPFDDITVFQQGNVKASRKQVMPVLKAFLLGDHTPESHTPEETRKDIVPDEPEAGVSSSFNAEGSVNNEDENAVLSNVTFHIESLDELSNKGSVDRNDSVPSPHMESFRNYEQIDLDDDQYTANTSNSSLVKSEHVLDFDLLTSGDNENTGGTTLLSTNPYPDFPSSCDSDNTDNPDFRLSVDAETNDNTILLTTNPYPDFRSATEFESTNLSSAHSSNIFDLGISDSELVDPFSSVDDTLNLVSFEVGSKNPSIDENVADKHIPLDLKSEAESSQITHSAENGLFGETTEVNDNERVESHQNDQDVETERKPEAPENKVEKESILHDEDVRTEGSAVETEIPTFIDTDVEIHKQVEIVGKNSETATREFEVFGDYVLKVDKDNESDLGNPMLITVEDEPNAQNSHSFESDSESSASSYAANHVNFQLSDSDDDEGHATEKLDALSNIQKKPFSNLSFLDVNQMRSEHSHAKKSPSLIVECDARSQADDLAELEESELFDKIPTPEVGNSGENSPSVFSGTNTPFINSGMGTPLESASMYSSRTQSESGYGLPGFIVPPNSVMDRGFGTSDTDRGLPSFNSAEMVEKIHKKKASLGVGLDLPELDLPEQPKSGENSTPYTPMNSFRDDSSNYLRETSLPNLNDEEMIEKVKQKRNSLRANMGSDESGDILESPGNPDPDFSDSNKPVSDLDMFETFPSNLCKASNDNIVTSDSSNPFEGFSDFGSTEVPDTSAENVPISDPSNPFGDFFDSVTTEEQTASSTTVANTESHNPFGDMSEFTSNEVTATSEDEFPKTVSKNPFSDFSDLTSSEEHKTEETDVATASTSNPFGEFSEFGFSQDTDDQFGSPDSKNPFGDFADSAPETSQEPSFNPFLQMSENNTLQQSDFNAFGDNLDTNVENATERVMRTGIDVFDIFGDNSSETDWKQMENQTGSLDNFDFGETVTQSNMDRNLNPFLTSEFDQQPEFQTAPVDDLEKNFPERTDSTPVEKIEEASNEMTNNHQISAENENMEENIDQSILEALNDSANLEAADAISETIAWEIIHDAIETFPDLTNPVIAEQVTVHVIPRNDADWTGQRSGDSGIGSAGSPQQAPRPHTSPRRLHTDYSVETEYLPSMDPLHGSLNIVTSNPSMGSIETDADKEVVESESFRKASGEKQMLTSSSTYKPRVMEDIPEKIKEMIISENINTASLMVDARKLNTDDRNIRRDRTDVTENYLQHDAPDENEVNDRIDNDEDLLGKKRNVDIDLPVETDLATFKSELREEIPADINIVEDLKERILQENIEASIMDLDFCNRNNNTLPDHFQTQNEPQHIDIVKIDSIDKDSQPSDQEILDIFAAQNIENEIHGDEESSTKNYKSFTQKDDNQNKFTLLDFDNFEETTHDYTYQPVRSGEEMSDVLSDFFGGNKEDKCVKQIALEKPGDLFSLDISDLDIVKDSESMVSELSFDHDTMDLDDKNIADTVEIVADQDFGSKSDTNEIKDDEKLHESSDENESGAKFERDSDNVFDRNTQDVFNETELEKQSGTLLHSIGKAERDDGSVSPDTNSSYRFTSDSESELITVKEIKGTLLEKTDQDIGADEILSQLDEIDHTEDFEYDGNETSFVERGEEYYCIKTEADKIFNEKSVSRAEVKHYQWENSEIDDDNQHTEIAMKHVDEENIELSKHDLSQTDSSFGAIMDKDKLIVKETMSVSVLTTETVSPAETPEDENASGFYEINPELTDSKTMQSLTSSAFETNLGDNETGFYEVNKEENTMEDSVGSMDGEVGAETKSSEKIVELVKVSGFYETNAEKLERAIDKDSQNYLLIDEEYSDMSVSPLETPEFEQVTGFYDVAKLENENVASKTNMKDLYEMNAQKLEKVIERADTLDLSNSLMVDSTMSDDSNVSPMETPDIESVSGFYEIGENNTDIASVENKDIKHLGPEDAPDINIELVESEQSSKDSFDSETEPSFELQDKESTGEELKRHEEATGSMNDVGEKTNTDFKIEEMEKVSCRPYMSGEFDTSPQINVEMFTSTDTVESQGSTEGFYQMNAELQGTVLQNIEIGNVFSPIESPSEEVFHMQYEINPMIQDVKAESSESSDEDVQEKERRPFVRFSSDVQRREVTSEVDKMADNLVEKALHEAIGTINFKGNVDEQRAENVDFDERIVKVADDLVSKATTSAIEVVQDLQLNEKQPYIINQIANAMKEDSDSSDSEGSSTTTEGSYRIDNSVEILSPDKDMVTSTEFTDVTSLGEIGESFDTGFGSKRNSVLNDQEGGVKDANLFGLDSAEQLKDFDFEENIDTELMDKDLEDDNDFEANVSSNDENGNMTEEKELDEPKTALDQEGNIIESSIEENEDEQETVKAVSDKIKAFQRQDTLIPDIVISKEETPPDSDENEMEFLKKSLEASKEAELLARRNEWEDDEDLADIDTSNAKTQKLDTEIESKKTEVLETFDQTITDTDSNGTAEKVKCSEEIQDLTSFDEIIKHGSKVTDMNVNKELSENGGYSETDIKHRNLEIETKGQEHNSKDNWQQPMVKDLESEKDEKFELKQKKGYTEYVTRKEIFYTSAGRMSVSIDSVMDPPTELDQGYPAQDIIHEEHHEMPAITHILERANSAMQHADEVLLGTKELEVKDKQDDAQDSVADDAIIQVQESELRNTQEYTGNENLDDEIITQTKELAKEQSLKNVENLDSDEFLIHTQEAMLQHTEMNTQNSFADEIVIQAKESSKENIESKQDLEAEKVWLLTVETLENTQDKGEDNETDKTQTQTLETELFNSKDNKQDFDADEIWIQTLETELQNTQENAGELAAEKLSAFETELENKQENVEDFGVIQTLETVFDNTQEQAEDLDAEKVLIHTTEITSEIELENALDLDADEVLIPTMKTTLENTQEFAKEFDLDKVLIQTVVTGFEPTKEIAEAFDSDEVLIPTVELGFETSLENEDADQALIQTVETKFKTTAEIAVENTQENDKVVDTCTSLIQDVETEIANTNENTEYLDEDEMLIHGLETAIQNAQEHAEDLHADEVLIKTVESPFETMQENAKNADALENRQDNAEDVYEDEVLMHPVDMEGENSQDNGDDLDTNEMLMQAVYTELDNREENPEYVDADEVLVQTIETTCENTPETAENINADEVLIQPMEITFEQKTEKALDFDVNEFLFQAVESAEDTIENAKNIDADKVMVETVETDLNNMQENLGNVDGDQILIQSVDTSTENTQEHAEDLHVDKVLIQNVETISENTEENEKDEDSYEVLIKPMKVVLENKQRNAEDVNTDEILEQTVDTAIVIKQEYAEVLIQTVEKATENIQEIIAEFDADNVLVETNDKTVENLQEKEGDANSTEVLLQSFDSELEKSEENSADPDGFLRQSLESALENMQENTDIGAEEILIQTVNMEREISQENAEVADADAVLIQTVETTFENTQENAEDVHVNEVLIQAMETTLENTQKHAEYYDVDAVLIQTVETAVDNTKENTEDSDVARVLTQTVETALENTKGNTEDSDLDQVLTQNVKIAVENIQENAGDDSENAHNLDANEVLFQTDITGLDNKQENSQLLDDGINKKTSELAFENTSENVQDLGVGEHLIQTNKTILEHTEENNQDVDEIFMQPKESELEHMQETAEALNANEVQKQIVETALEKSKDSLQDLHANKVLIQTVETAIEHTEENTHDSYSVELFVQPKEAALEIMQENSQHVVKEKDLIQQSKETPIDHTQENVLESDDLIQAKEAAEENTQENVQDVDACVVNVVNGVAVVKDDADGEILSEQSQPADEEEDVIPEKHVIKEAVKAEKTKPGHEKMKMDDTQEWHEDPIPGMGATQDVSSDESDSDSDSEYGKAARPDSLLNGARRKLKKIEAKNFLSPDSTDDLIEGVDDIPTPDDLETPSDMEGELEWEDDTPMTPNSENKKFAEYHDDDDEKEKYENTKFRKVEIAGKDFRVDMKVIEPYKKVLSHGGYYGDGLNAIILFSGCYLPDRGRKDYQYVMDNLFLYVISTLELLVAEDYMIVYFHGATPRRQMPSFGWLKRCYQMIDRRLRKNLKALLMVHPTLWLKTVVMMTKPFISSKFSSKLQFVKTLQELGKIVPMEYIYVPETVSHTERMLQTDPEYLEKWEREMEKTGQQEMKKNRFKLFSKKK